MQSQLTATNKKSQQVFVVIILFAVMNDYIQFLAELHENVRKCC